MSTTISTLKKKFLGRKSNEASDGMNIGRPTNVKTLYHAERDGESGGIRGLPPEMQKMLESMTTAEER